MITVNIRWPQCFFFFHGDLDMKNYSNIIFITYLGDKTENVKKMLLLNRRNQMTCWMPFCFE